MDALGHTEQTVAGYAATCTEAGLTDGVICSVCDAVITEQTAIPATGHTYIDGTCSCGATDVCKHKPGEAVIENTVESTLEQTGSYDEVIYCSVCGEELSRETKECLVYPFQSYTVELSSQLNININTKYDVLGFASAADAQASGYYALVTRIDADGTSVESIIPATDWIGHTKSRVRIPYNSWNPTQMVDTFTVVICNSNGEVVTEAIETSVVEIVMDQIETYAAYDGAYDNLITLFVDLLNYGAASQVQFEYNDNNLANANLGEWQSYATTEIVYPAAKNNSSVACYQTTSLELKSRVDLQLQLWTDSFGVDMSEVVAEISYTDFNGNLVKKEIKGTDFQPHTPKNGRGRCKVIVSWIDIPDCMQDVTIVLKDSNGNEIATITESIISKLGYYYEQYPDNAIYSEMIKFISSANAYFAG